MSVIKILAPPPIFYSCYEEYIYYNHSSQWLHDCECSDEPCDYGCNNYYDDLCACQRDTCYLSNDGCYAYTYTHCVPPPVTYPTDDGSLIDGAYYYGLIGDDGSGTCPNVGDQWYVYCGGCNLCGPTSSCNNCSAYTCDNAPEFCFTGGSSCEVVTMTPSGAPGCIRATVTYVPGGNCTAC